eukprot:1138535-Pelagomonas_calceolata.AAC.4
MPLGKIFNLLALMRCMDAKLHAMLYKEQGKTLGFHRESSPSRLGHAALFTAGSMIHIQLFSCLLGMRSS